MRKIKVREEFNNPILEPILEAKEWPVDMIVKCNDISALGIKYGGWCNFSPSQVPTDDKGIFYMKIKTSGKTWIEGTFLIPNCLKPGESTRNYNYNRGQPSTYGYDLDQVLQGREVRVDKKYLSKPGPEYTILERDGFFSKKLFNKTIFLEGTEKGIMNTKGESIDVKEGEYRVIGVNYDLTVSMKETVLFLTSTKANSDFFYATIQTTETTGNELTDDQREVISNWFAKELGGAIITVSDKKEYIITHWYIESDGKGKFPSTFRAGPFVNKAQGEEILESILKLNKYSLFDPTKQEIKKPESWSSTKTTLTLTELIEWCRAIGIKTTMKDLLELKRGASNARGFGLG